MNYKSECNDKVKSSYQRFYEILLIVLGDRDCKDYSRRDIKNLLNKYQLSPARNKKPYNKMTLKEIFELEDIDESDMVSRKSVKELLKSCQSFFSTYLTKEEEVLEKSPTENVTYNGESKRYANFKNEQITELLMYLDGIESQTLKWSVLLALYSGCRRGDAIGLKKEDIILNEKSGRYYIWIEKGKTAAAKRAIPINQELQDEGFVGFIESIADYDYVFPDYQRNPSLLTEHFKNIISELGIGSVNADGEKYSFHSLRHTFITTAFAKGISREIIQQIVGHKIGNNGDITDIYTHNIDLSELFNSIDKITFKS